MKLKDKIRILRKARGFSQQELGDRLSKETYGLSRQSVSDWENGNSEPKLDNIRDLSVVLNVSFDALLDDSIDLNDSETILKVLNRSQEEKKTSISVSHNVYRTHLLPIIGILVAIVLILIFIVKQGLAIQLDETNPGEVKTIMDSLKVIESLTESNQNNVKILVEYIILLVTWFPIVAILIFVGAKLPNKYKVATITTDGIYLNKRVRYVSANEIENIYVSKFSFKKFGSLTIELKTGKHLIVPIIIDPDSASRFYSNIVNKE